LKQVSVQEEGVHQVLPEVEGRIRQEGDREGLGPDEEVLPGYPHHLPHPAEVAEAPPKEGSHRRDPAQWWNHRRQGNACFLLTNVLKL